MKDNRVTQNNPFNNKVIVKPRKESQIPGTPSNYQIRSTKKNSIHKLAGDKLSID